MKRTYYIPTIEITIVNTALMNSGLAGQTSEQSHSNLGGGGGHAPERRDPAF